MATITLAQAAEMAGVSYHTINRAVKSGKLSATLLSNGQRVIDPTELQRAFPSDRPKTMQNDTAYHDNINDSILIEQFNARIIDLQNTISILKSERDDLRSRLTIATENTTKSLLLIENKLSTSVTTEQISPLLPATIPSAIKLPKTKIKGKSKKR